MKNIIEFNDAIYPKVMSVYLGKSAKETDSENDNNMKPELAIDLPRGAYVLYIQNMFDEHKHDEIEVFKKYAYGMEMDDSDYSFIINILMTNTARKWNVSVNNNDVLGSFGICIHTDVKGKQYFSLIEEQKESIKVEAWEGILIDLLRKSAMDIISCFDFDAHFIREMSNGSGSDDLKISLSAWSFTCDEAEQRLSNTLRSAFIFTLAGYYSGDRKLQYSSFMDYFEEEFYKRVSLVFGVWSSLSDKKNIKYFPLYDSFHNLSSTSKSELISILKAVLDSEFVALDEKQVLKEQLIESAGRFHDNVSAEDFALEQSLIKPAINLVILREKAKDSLESAEILYSQDKYVDCANRCYYAMMFYLKVLLEHEGKLAKWKENELKESETHNSLENGLKDLVACGVLDASDEAQFKYVKDQRWKCDYSLYKFTKTDANQCLTYMKRFSLKVENIIG